VARKLAPLQQAAAEIDGDVHFLTANAGDLEAARATLGYAIAELGGLDILVNNAATNPYYGPMIDISPEQFDKIIQVNLRGPLFWSSEAWHQRFQRYPGVILNISSGGSVHVDEGLGVYNVAKAALNHCTRQLANELSPTRVVGIAPGLIDTDFSKVLVDSFGDRLRAALPARRLGTPQDVANLALLLVSDAGSYITGETYMVDGGIGSLGVNL
jgi:NAD(P)-dependent dehydrogenase (short-subunit alcohol dehydrogenase family)